MYLPPNDDTPEVDFRREKRPVLRLTGPCFPLPAQAFFARLVDGDANDRVNVPGLRDILLSDPTAAWEFVFDLHTINSRTEREALPDFVALLLDYGVKTKWVCHSQDESNERAYKAVCLINNILIEKL